MYELKVPMLKGAEIELLDQSVQAIEPPAKALNIFQGDNKCFHRITCFDWTKTES